MLEDLLKLVGKTAEKKETVKVSLLTLAFPARVPRLDNSLIAFSALAIAVGEGQMLTVSAMDFGLGPVDRLSALPAEAAAVSVLVVRRYGAIHRSRSKDTPKCLYRHQGKGSSAC